MHLVIYCSLWCDFVRLKQIITFLFSYYIRQEHFRVAEFLPVRDCLQQDAQRTGSDLDFLKESYLQPELAAERKIWPESLDEENKMEKTSGNEDSGEELKWNRCGAVCGFVYWCVWLNSISRVP